MKVASVQVEIRDGESKQERIDRVSAMLDALQEYDLILLPEIWATGYFSFDRYISESEPLDGPFVHHFAARAKALGAYVLAGSFVEQNGEKYHNTSVLFDRQGELVGTSRKIHLFRYGSQEGNLLTRGDQPVVVDTEFGKIGLSTCYDLRFPELYRAQVDLGAKLYLVTSAWPLQRLPHWNLFNQARALENQCFLVSCNCVGTTQNVELGGHSQVVDPWGAVTASTVASETVLRADIDLRQVDQIRETFPQLKHRVL